MGGSTINSMVATLLLLNYGMEDHTSVKEFKSTTAKVMPNDDE